MCVCVCKHMDMCPAAVSVLLQTVSKYKRHSCMFVDAVSCVLARGCYCRNKRNMLIRKQENKL